MFRFPKQSPGFTLIELLVVMAIIGILASAVLASLQDARAEARDAIRRQNLHELKVAMEVYYNTHKTYQVNGSGYLGGGQGWVSFINDPTYVTAVTEVLFGPGSFLEDPLQNPGYMLYTCDGGQTYAISATLEKPTPADISHIQTTCNGIGSNGTYTRYGKNYAISND
jgi:prepilin-type N-terminal cleavage/methylation domain-containing protein